MTVRTKLAFVITLVIAAVVFHVGRSVALVLDSAAELAAAEPYCIQVADAESDYRPAEARLDLSEITMWAKREGGMYMQRHAVLVVGSLASPRLFHWSYRAGHFIQETTNLAGGFGISCSPRQDFAHALPILIRQTTSHDVVRFSATEVYRIPKQYQMNWRGAGARGTLFVIAPAPDFLPQTKSVSALRSDGQLDAQWISLSHDPAWLLSLMNQPPAKNTLYSTEGETLGLRHTRTIFTGADTREYVGHIYSAGGTNLEHATYISCGPKSCQHRFLSNGRHFYFRHAPEQVREWKEMQAKILRLFEAGAAQS